MMLKTIISKPAHLIAELYDLYHAFEDVKTPTYLLYHGDTSKLLYYGSLIEEKSLWSSIFKTLIGYENSIKAREILESLDNVINVYKWDEVEEKLKNHSKELIRVYDTRREKIREMLTRILGVNKFFHEIYLIMAYNPIHGLIGSLPLYDENGKYAVINLFIGPGVTPEKTLDLALHELIHGLIRVNDLNVPEDVEEEFIDALCPEGYLSRELGLATEINV